LFKYLFLVFSHFKVSLFIGSLIYIFKAVRWLKNGSFAFAEGLVCAVGAKENVPFMLRQ
jgi:hypothetical protein